MDRLRECIVLYRSIGSSLDYKGRCGCIGDPQAGNILRSGHWIKVGDCESYLDLFAKTGLLKPLLVL